MEWLFFLCSVLVSLETLLVVRMPLTTEILDPIVDTFAFSLVTKFVLCRRYMSILLGHGVKEETERGPLATSEAKSLCGDR